MANPSIVVEFIAETAKLVAGANEVSAAGDKAAGSLNKIDWGRVAKFAGAAAAIGASVAFLKNASDATTDLTKQTMALQRATGMETETASAWVSLLQVRGIEANTFGTAMTKLSKNMETWSNNSAKGGKALQELGVRFADVKAGNVQAVILQVADGLAKIENPAKRAALASQLFGRAGTKLIPVLQGGSKGIEEQIKTVEKYGAVVGDKQVAQTQKVIQAQRELALAHKGVQVAIGSALLPAQAELYGSLLSLVQVVLPFVNNVDVMKAGLIAWAVALGVLKVATIASTVAQLGLDAAMLPTIGIVAAIVVGIAALIAIGVLLYKNWDTIAALAGTVWNAIKSAAQSVFDWFKANWPLLVGILAGPFGIALALIITHWHSITSAVSNALTTIRNAITTAFNFVVSIVTSAMRALVAAILGALGAAVAAASAIASGVRAVFAGAIGWLTTAGRNIVQGLASAVRGAIGLATSAANAIESAVKRAFADAGSWLVAAGRNIVMGLVHGIESAIGAAVGAVERLSDLASKAFSLKNKIFSPSRVYAEYGRQIVLGLAQGITRNAGLVTRAVGALGAQPVSAGTTDAAAGLTTGNLSVHVYIGDVELRSLVRTELVSDNARVARRLLAGNA